MRSLYVGLAAACLATAPAAAQKAADYELDCASAADSEWCKVQLVQFRKWFPLALRGDYQGQRNVAFCLFDGCDGAVHVNKITACAWRAVILASGSLKIDRSDTMNMDLCRRHLTPDELVASAGQAATLAARVGR